mmetsp:Transcript_14666/g.33986  ORF Transcript_14666/g.33986 Transcript_14666/m.33986 type:complete len:494 (-) Transcript_14666:377-1858(-)
MSDMDCTCPICLESLTCSEHTIYPLPCENCDFNFCNNCVKSFCDAAADDYQIASDGSRQVKITVACPQCRSKYPIDLEETVLLLRKAHALASAILIKEEYYRDEKKEDISTKPSTALRYTYQLMSDSDLSASQLAGKSEFSRHSMRKKLEAASALYEKAVAKRKRKGSITDDSEPLEERADLWRDLRAESRDLWTALLDQLPSNTCRCDNAKARCDGSCGSRTAIEVVLKSSGSFSPDSTSPVVDETLFQGFDEFINRDEKVFLTDLFTGGDVRGVAQAALIMNGVRRLALSPPRGETISRRAMMGDEPPMTKQQLQKHVDYIEQTKLQFPLPNHMPGYFLIPTFSRRDGYMILKDTEWDGLMTPPQRSKRVFEHVYGKHYTPPGPPYAYPLTVAVVHAVKGPVGRLGLRRGDVITHVNDAEWHGTAEDLQDYIYSCHAHIPGDEISITVNANEETCEFLRIRREMMIKRAREQKVQQQKKAAAKAAKAAAKR